MSIQSEINRLKQNVANAFTAVGNKGGTVPSAKVSGNLATAINTIPSGVTVQRKSGTVKSAQTINCGFKPDLVVLRNTEAGADGWYHPAFAFTAMNMETLLAQAEITDGFYYFSVTQTTTGFKCNYVNFYDFDWNWSGSNYTGSFDYTAVKYT